MQNETAYSDLIKVILTNGDRNILLEEIALLSESLFKTDAKAFETVLNDKVRKKVADIIRFYVEKGVDKKTMFKELEEKFKVVALVDLTIAFDPTTSFVNRIVKWIRLNIGELLLNLKVDPLIIGGAIVSYNGKISDGSVLKKLNEEGF